LTVRMCHFFSPFLPFFSVGFVGVGFVDKNPRPRPCERRQSRV
jgi:hypothetical protein